MSTEITHLKKDTTAGNSDSTDVASIEKISIYHNRCLIFAGSLLATWFVLVAVAGKRSGGGAVDSMVPATTTNSALNMDIFGIANSATSGGCVDKYHICAGTGRGNCCKGLECDGPFFGTCQKAKCAHEKYICFGFGQGSCCPGLTCRPDDFPFPTMICWSD